MARDIHGDRLERTDAIIETRCAAFRSTTDTGLSAFSGADAVGK